MLEQHFLEQHFYEIDKFLYNSAILAELFISNFEVITLQKHILPLKNMFLYVYQNEELAKQQFDNCINLVKANNNKYLIACFLNREENRKFYERFSEILSINERMYKYEVSRFDFNKNLIPYMNSLQIEKFENFEKNFEFFEEEIKNASDGEFEYIRKQEYALLVEFFIFEEEVKKYIPEKVPYKDFRN